MLKPLRALLPALALALLLPGARQAMAQCVSLTTLGSASSQNFNTLSNTAGSTTNNLTITGWFMNEEGMGARDNEQYAVDTGGSNTGDTFSYGAAGNTERALGALQSGTLIPTIGVCFTNNTGSTIASLDVAYTGEQWRIGNTAAARDDRLDFQYSTNATSLTTGTWTDVNALDFTNPIKTAGTAGALDGNAAANRTAISNSIASLSIANGATFWIRWNDLNASGADDGLAVDDFSLTPQGGGPPTPVLNVNDVALAEGNPPGTTTFTFTVSLTAPAGPGGVTFDIATADGTAQDDTPATEDNDYVAQSLTGQTIPAGSSTYAFNVTVNRDTAAETNETFFVNVTSVTGANAGDTQGQGTINNDDVAVIFIHDVQGNGAATPISGATVTVEGIVIGDYQASTQLSGFFLQEENADVDADPATSEGIFVFCSGCPTAVAEGQRVQVTGTVSEFFNLTEITASTAGSVVVTNAGNNLAQVTPASIDLPVAGVVNDFYEAREGMLVTFVDTLTVAEYFELFRFGHIELFEGGRPRQFTEANPPSVAGLNAHLDNLDRRRVILDDTDNTPNAPLNLPDGSQFVFHPRANGGFSIGTQGTDFFRGGDVVNGLTGVLHWSFAGTGSADAWRIRPTNATPAAFTVANPRPATPPAVGGAIKAVGMNLLNYFTTIDTTSSNNSGTCAPSMTQDCRGADSVAELNRQRERASIVICTLNADVYGFGELENTTASATITDLLGAVNARCGGAHPYAFVSTGGTLGTDAIRVALIYRTGILSPVGPAVVDLDPVHNRPPTAQTFDVVDAANPAFGERFTVIANHFKSKGCDASALGADADAGDGQSCYNGTRVAQANRLLAWISGTVVPAAGDPDVLLLGDFNAYAQEDPVTTIAGGGYTDLQSALLGPAAYSYLFDGQLGHLDYAFSSASLTPQVTGVGAWHINADEVPLLDYNDEIRDTGEATFEEKPDGSALVPPRVVFQPASPFRASDHDPVIAGLFQIADLSITKTDSPDPVTAGTSLTYTITVTNSGPDPATNASWTDTLPAGTTFVSLPAVAGWSCTTPAVGATGTVSCSNPTFAVGSAVFTLTVQVDVGVAGGTVLSNTATVTSDTGDSDGGDTSATATTTVVAPTADLSVTKTDFPDPVVAGNNLTYFITVTNAGPDAAVNASWSDTLPAGTTFGSLPAVAGWSCTTGATVSCSNPSFAPGSASFTLTVAVDPSVAAGTVLSNTATASSATSDPNPGNESATTTTTVISFADLSVTKTDSPDPVSPGGTITYTITVANAAGSSNAATVALSDTLPAETTFVSLSSPAGWSCTTPAVGANGTVSCSIASLATGGSAVFTLTVAVDAGTLAGTVISNTASVTSASTDPNPGNESATATTDVVVFNADLSVTKVDTPDPVSPGGTITYTITVTNAGPDAAISASLSDTLPTGTTFVSLSVPGGWSCTTPAVGAGGDVSCSIGSLSVGSAVFTLVVQVDPSVLPGTEITNLAAAASAVIDPNPKDEIGVATTIVSGSADLSVTKVDTPDPVAAGASLTYTITVTNAGPNYAGTVALSDTLPVGTTFQSLSAPAGWLCSTPAVGGTGAINCSLASFAPGSAVFTLAVQVGSGLANGTVLTNTATVTSATTDLNPGNESATATTTVTNSTVITATKTAGGDFNPGGTVTYTIVLTNTSGLSQADNPGDEFTDVLPAQLELVSASATSGLAATDLATDTVTWNGPIAAGASVTITIQATVREDAAPGTTVSNQGTVFFDANGDGTNESSAPTDDPAAGGGSNPTNFVVAGGGSSVVEIPTLNEVGLALLALLLACGGAVLMRRRARS